MEEGQPDRLQGVFVVHGEEEQSKALAEALNGLGVRNVVVPQVGQTIQI
jgi:hypothetical protein